MSQSNDQSGKRKIDSDENTVKDLKRRRQDEEISQKNIQDDGQLKLAAKARKIIQRNFDQEILLKEDEIDQLDNLLLQTLKGLHSIRLSTLTKKYGHQVVKNGNLKISGKIHASNSKGQDKLSVQKSDKLHDGESLSPKLQSSDVAHHVKPVGIEAGGTRVLKKKRRIIVGNVSRWIGCEQKGDAITHKWMIYVRGSEAEPDLSDVVSKIQFLIHESYEPNNLIVIESLPYHLSRRGWGEFPAKIKIYFQNPLDKPIDIVHNLKLDKTHSGKQTLGAETHVDVWLHQAKSYELQKSSSIPKSSLRVSPSSNLPNKDFDHAKIQEEVKPQIQKRNGVKKRDLPWNNHENSLTTLVRCKDKEGVSHFLPMTILPKKGLNRGDKSHSRVRPLQPTMTNDHISRSPQANMKNVETVRSLLKSSVLPPGTSLLRANHGPLATPPNTPTNQSRSVTPTKVFGERNISWEYVLKGPQNMVLEEFEQQILQIDSSYAQDDMSAVFSLRRKLLSIEVASLSDSESSCIGLFRLFPSAAIASKTSKLYRFLLPYTYASETEYQSDSFASKKYNEITRAKVIHKILEGMGSPLGTRPHIQLLLTKYGFCISDGSLPLVDHRVDFRSLSTYTTLESTRNLIKTEPFVDIVDVTALQKSPRQPKESFSSLSLQKCSNKHKFPQENWGALQFIQDTVEQLGICLGMEEIPSEPAFPVSQKILLMACQYFCEELLHLGHGEVFEETNSCGEIKLHHLVKGLVKSPRNVWLTNQYLGGNP